MLWAKPIDYFSEVKPIFAENCYRCHGAAQQKSGLRMDTALFALKGGENGPAWKPGKASESLLMQVINGIHPEIARMPFKKPALSQVQVDLIGKWINEAVVAPADEAPEASKHWAFIPPIRRSPAAVVNAQWIRNPVDNFIVSRLEKENIKPAPVADRVTLIRRLSLDLTGLPPSIAEVESFVNDTQPNAYERLVDGLLASAHYGERWGRHWLDVARYADSNGYSIDAPRSIWKYRDWVIHALNQDLPYDDFVIEQLAGDLLPDPTIDQKIATGFHRNTQINQEGGIDPEQFRIESILDRVGTTGTAFLGLTIGCAQCHDHKFDPITQREFYQLFAFFNNTMEDGHGKAAPEGVLEIPGEFEPMENVENQLEELRGDLNRFLDTKGKELVAWEQSLSAEAKQKLKPEIQRATEIPFPERSLEQKRVAFREYDGKNADFKDRDSKLSKLEKRQPKPITTLVMVELKQPRDSFIFTKGDFTRHGEKVGPGVPAVLPPFKVADPGRTNRLDLARWIASPENPLTARVIVNRIWQQYFGRGLVETENDFGTQGSLPTHPELLDWLATELVNPSVDSGAKPWSLKHIHRLIVTSATYRQSSHARPELAVIDPNNHLLARQVRLRLDSEIVRDVCLAASGLLNDTVGGPSVFPPQPDGVMALGQSKRPWTVSPGTDRYRRGLYTFYWRATPHPALAVFDSPDALSACTRRTRSNTPLQALTLLNDAAFYDFSQAFAARILKEGGSSDAAKVERAFEVCLSRKPQPKESKRLLNIIERELVSFTNAPDEAHALLTASTAGRPDFKELAAWTTVARVLLNLDETVTRE
ncbi:MAG: cytochrome [Verrucomicrobiales bacterium]|nr:cytochrome [Verrucomicrobiales bacterium]